MSKFVRKSVVVVASCFLVACSQVPEVQESEVEVKPAVSQELKREYAKMAGESTAAYIASSKGAIVDIQLGSDLMYTIVVSESMWNNSSKGTLDSFQKKVERDMVNILVGYSLLDEGQYPKFRYVGSNTGKTLATTVFNW